MLNKLKNINLTDKQKKILNLAASICTALTLLALGIWVVVYYSLNPEPNIKPQQIISYVITYGGLILLIWKVILLLLHTKKIKQFGESEQRLMSPEIQKGKGNKKVPVENFKSNGFEFVENKKEVVIKITKEFESSDLFLTSFKCATLEFCEKIRKDNEKKR